MRLHRLRLRAFGPFPGEECVDFDSLAESGLFLFHGATGAGKTSLLDAVCFALYGQVPGSRGTARLRSDHAGPDDRAEVELELTVRGRRLRVTRWPAWERPKRRGDGMTTEPAKVRVDEIGSTGSVRTLATRMDEAGHLLGGLLGMTHSQFTQVALLPQGQFAEFLRADADDRRRLLATLFDTQRFTAVEGHLVGLRQSLRRELDVADAAVAEVVSRVREVCGPLADPSELLAPDQRVSADHTVDPDAALDPDRVVTLVELAVELLAAATAGRDAALAERDAAAAAYQRAAEANRLAERRAEVRRRADASAAAGPERDTLAERLAASRRAAPVVHGARGLSLQAARLATAVRAVEAAPAMGLVQIDLPAAVGAEALAVAHRLQIEESEVRREVVVLDGLAETARQVDELRAELAGIEQCEVEQSTRAEQVARWFADLPARRADAERSRDASRAATVRVEVLRGSLEGLATRLEAARRAGHLRASLERIEARRVAAVDAVQCAKTTWLDLRARRLDGIAAELAARLADGEPCSVCGSPSHPAPAARGVDAVDRTDEDSAHAEVEGCEQVLTALSAERSSVDRDLAQAELLAGGASVDELRQRHAEVSAELAATEALAARATADQEALTALAQQTEQRTLDQQAAAEALTRTRSRLEDLRLRVATLGGEVDRARGEDASVDARMARLTGVADAAAALAARLAEVARLREEVEEARAEADLQAVAAGFSGLTAAQEALLDEAAVARTESRLRALDDEQAAVDELLSDPALAADDDEAPVDLDGARARLEAADEQYAAAVSAHARADDRHAALTRLSADLARSWAAREPVQAAFDVADRMSRLAEGKSGDNRLRMSLTAYVLAARLEQVALAASDRLARMSDGRYRLVHTALSPKGRGGLHLEVVDAWTGLARDPATLSGGESFYASLALALGLADVVTAEAGGATIETLFVDEGFGSLDDEALDEVMDVLDGLRSGGRCVGVVSHVADLRQRIPAQVRVRKGRTGSTVDQTVGALDSRAG